MGGFATVSKHYITELNNPCQKLGLKFKHGLWCHAYGASGNTLNTLAPSGNSLICLVHFTPLVYMLG